MPEVNLIERILEKAAERARKIGDDKVLLEPWLFSACSQIGLGERYKLNVPQIGEQTLFHRFVYKGFTCITITRNNEEQAQDA